MERKSEVPETVAEIKANPVTRRLFSKMATRGGVTAEEAITDFSTVMEAHENATDSGKPTSAALTDAEKNMNFADLIQNKMGEAEGSSKEDVDRKVRELQEKYKLSDKERSVLVDEMGSNLKGSGGGGNMFKKLFKIAFKLLKFCIMEE